MAAQVANGNQKTEEMAVSNGQSVPSLATLSSETVGKESINNGAGGEGKVVGNGPQSGQNGDAAQKASEETTNGLNANGDKKSEESKSGNETTANGDAVTKSVVNPENGTSETAAKDLNSNNNEPKVSLKNNATKVGDAEPEAGAKKGRGRPPGKATKVKQVEVAEEVPAGVRRSGRNAAKPAALAPGVKRAASPLPMEETKGRKKAGLGKKK